MREESVWSIIDQSEASVAYLGDVSDPGRLLLLGGRHQVHRQLGAGLDGLDLELEVEAVVVVCPGPRPSTRGRAQVTDAARATHARAE